MGSLKFLKQTLMLSNTPLFLCMFPFPSGSCLGSGLGLPCRIDTLLTLRTFCIGFELVLLRSLRARRAVSISAGISGFRG
jgi:hypothetical protein